jgi:hypothetical protein
MIAVASLLTVLTVSILVTRVATLALTHTGLSKESARFQARSAFTGAGFTTTESERVVNHPVRRRIVLVLMLLGNAGIVSAVSSLILTFVNQNGSGTLPVKIVLLVTGVVLLWLASRSAWMDRHLSWIIDKALRRYTRLDVRDYASLMHLIGDYRIVELEVQPDGWLADRRLGETALRDEGVLVLGIKRADGTYLGAPKGDAEILPGDELILYGRVTALEELDIRKRSPRGDREHREAVEEQREVAAKEAQADRESGERLREGGAGTAGRAPPA